ncbi:MAG: type I DNA topoisomerase [Bacilli bacterium]|nr:type I DNA topoisomerase [Bacilli bacterium]
MAKNLVIVESPSKSKTIEKYLGSDYKVLSSKGHIRDLSTKGRYGLGVDIEDNFKPNYITIKGKKKDVESLKKEVKASDHVYLATDPDREGEAISWHLFDALGLNNDNYDRVVFNEITKPAIIDAFKHPRKIDQNLVNSQETRRILDRIIGFRLSKLIQSKTNGSSAGRVQSVALKLIVEKEREINAFNPEEYWTITANFDDFSSSLGMYNHKDLEINSEVDANNILNNLSDKFTVTNIDVKEKSKASKFPFITSTLQQEASTKLGFNAKKTMSIAQKLYEGIELENETVGLISYMRTDSVRFSDEFIGSCYKYISDEYGKDYVGFVKKSKKSDNVQDAHEAIRPTSVFRTPILVKKYLSNDEYKLYRLIYYRALASLMAPAKTKNTSIILDNNNYQFKLNGQIVTFDGYLKVYSDYEDTKDQVLPELKVNDILSTSDIVKEQHFTKPPSRYTEAKLIKDLEELGIGRPSTYATIIDTIKKRGYVVITEKKFVPTEIGIEITDKLAQSFDHIINVTYTANMENDLDKIALGDQVWYETLQKFYNEFEPALVKAFDELPKKEVKETGEKCPECGSPLVVRRGKFGEFVACGGFPNCKYIKPSKVEVVEVCDCPNCDGKIIAKKSKRGKVFYGCNNYPECKTAYWDKPINKMCPECNSMLTEKGKKIKCSSCDYTE